MGYTFAVRRPLRSKQGEVSEQVKGGSLEQIKLNLNWPSLTITRGGDSPEQFPIQHSTFKPSKTDDKQHGGSKAYAIEVYNNKSREIKLWYVDSEDERKDWAWLLRKHAVHHDISNGFKQTNQVLGTGAFSTVYLAKDLVSFESVALKVIKKSRLNEDDKKLLTSEIRIAQAVTHKYCVSTREFIENAETYVLVMEYVGGGELFLKIVKYVYSEADVRRIMIQLMRATDYLHSRGICHRDLKPENFLLTTDSPPVVKIGDYGIATDVEPSRKNTCLKDGASLRCSPGYGAPEIVELKPYGLPVDLWSLGVCMFLLLTGVQPFNGSSEAETRSLMRQGVYDASLLRNCDPSAHDLVSRLLDKNPETRITAQAALHHSFLLPSNVDEKAHGNGGDDDVCCNCFGRKTLTSQQFRDPSAHSRSLSGAITPSFVDSSVRLGNYGGGGAVSNMRGGGFGQPARTDYTMR